jgi:glycosyltransferase involved in cell wall biosynthesis
VTAIRANPTDADAPRGAAAAVPGDAAGGPAARRRLRLAYLTTEYPAISHSFIRRELREIERRGHPVLRLSIRRPRHEPVDPEDREEMGRTTVCLEQPLRRFGAAMAFLALRRPAALWGAFRVAMRMARRAGGTWARHAAYLVEAAYLVTLLRREGVEHVHVHFGHNAAAVARLVRALGGPTYSFIVHGTETLDAPAHLSLGDKIHDAAFAVGASDFCAAQMRRWARPEDWPRIGVVRCGIDASFLDAASPVPGDSRELVCVGRYSGEKGQSLLLEALARLRSEGIGGRLVLVGDGDLRGALERQAAALRLGDAVEFAGWAPQHEVRRRLARARALVLPSLMEGLPVVLLEAMAMGRPVIASAVAGIPEVVRPGVNGWLVTVGRVDELAAAMREALLAPADVLTRMGERGRQAVMEGHRIERTVDGLERLLLRATGGRDR